MENTIYIEFSPVRCRITSDISSEITNLLYDTLAYRSSGYFFSPKFQSGVWDGYNHLFSKKTLSFRAGLLYRVRSILLNEGFEVAILNAPPPTVYTKRSNTYDLRPYQITAVQRILQYRFGIIQSPPRSGKTHMALAAIDSERKFPTVILCRSLDLAYQTVARAEKFIPEIKVGFVGDGVSTLGDLNVVTVQSAYAAFNLKYKTDKGEQKERPLTDAKESVRALFDAARQVYYDEAHESSGRTSRIILDKCINADLKIGLSATPFEEEDEESLRVEEFVGPVIHKISYSELIKEGFLLAPVIYLYKLPKQKVDGNYQSVYKQAVTDNEFLSGLVKKVVDKLIGLGHSVVVQTEFREQSKKLAKELGYPFLIGNEPAEKRQVLIKQLDVKEIPCLVSTLIEQGIDIPSLNFTINLVGGAKMIPTIQRIRSMTADGGKRVCGVIDFEFQCKYLKKHSNRRKIFYQSEPEFKLLYRDVSKKSLEEIV